MSYTRRILKPKEEKNKQEEPSVKKEEKSSKLIYRIKIRSRHPSHEPLRTCLPLISFPAVVRLGSTTELHDKATLEGKRIELNSIRGIKNSSDKSLMKKAFSEYGVQTADYFIPKSNEVTVGEKTILEPETGNELPYPVIAKHFFGSRNRGNFLIKNQKEMQDFIINRCLSEYVFEKYYSYVREYRVHIMNGESIYACRKMLKRDTPDDQRWHRHDDNCVWITEYKEILNDKGEFVEFSTEDKPEFDKPVNWNEIVSQCILATKAVGLDFAAIDLKVESALDKNGNKKERCNFIIIETNSAPSLGEKTLVMYTKHIPKALEKKFKQKDKNHFIPSDFFIPRFTITHTRAVNNNELQPGPQPENTTEGIQIFRENLTVNNNPATDMFALSRTNHLPEIEEMISNRNPTHLAFIQSYTPTTVLRMLTEAGVVHRNFLLDLNTLLINTDAKARAFYIAVKSVINRRNLDNISASFSLQARRIFLNAYPNINSGRYLNSSFRRILEGTVFAAIISLVYGRNHVSNEQLEQFIQSQIFKNLFERELQLIIEA